jgi:hypothetical protein
MPLAARCGRRLRAPTRLRSRSPSSGWCTSRTQPAGKKSNLSVTLKVEQSPAGENVWSTVVVRTVTGRQQTPLYWGHRWRPAEYGAVDAKQSYDVRITRLSGDTDEERNFSKCFWTALRTITAGDPVPAPGITLIAVRIRATGQLQGTIDEFNVTARTIARDWDASTGSWIWRPTSSPAALFRHILQHPSRRKPAPTRRSTSIGWSTGMG